MSLDKLARRLDDFLEESPHPRAKQARQTLDLEPRGLSIWQRLRLPEQAR